MTISPPSTAIPNMELSLLPTGRRSEHDLAVSHVGGSPHIAQWAENVCICLLFLNWLLFYLPPAVTPPPSWRSPHFYAIGGEEQMWNNVPGRKLFFLCAPGNTAANGSILEVLMSISMKAISWLSSVYSRGYWERACRMLWLGFWRKQKKQLT